MAAQMLEPLKCGEDAPRWLQCLKAVAQCQEWTGDKKKNAFLAYIGAEIYNLLADAVLPALLADKSFDKLEKLLVEQVQAQETCYCRMI